MLTNSTISPNVLSSPLDKAKSLNYDVWFLVGLLFFISTIILGYFLVTFSFNKTSEISTPTEIPQAIEYV